MTANQSFLMVAAIPISGSTLQTISIRKITIQATLAPPSFGIGSSVTSLNCGNTDPITFSISNNNFTPGVTGYTWNLGAIPNGWIYNGSPAPATVNTGLLNTLILSPDCGKPLSSISGTVSVNNSSVNTNNTRTITINQPAYAISGPAALCSGSNSYSLTGLPCNATVQWTSSDISLATITSSGNPSIVTKQGTASGRININAQVNACGAQVPVTRQISVGNPVPLGTTVTFQGPVVTNFPTISNVQMLSLSTGQNGYASFRINDPAYSSFSWSPIVVDPGTSWTVLANNSQLDVNIPFNSFGTSNSRTVTIRLNATGPCGSYFIEFTVRAIKRAGFLAFSVSPNPASTSITVSSTNQTQRLTTRSASLIYKLRVRDQSGNLKKQLDLPNGSTTTNITTTDLAPGLYIIEVFDGVEWSSQQFVKK